MLISEIELKSQAVVDCLILKKELRQDRNGKNYGFFVITDGDKKIEARMWEEPNAVPYDEGYVCAVKIKRDEYQGKDSYTIVEIHPQLDKNLTIEDFVDRPPYDIDMMYNHLIDVLKSYADNAPMGGYEPISGIALSIIERNKEAFKLGSAAVSMHHNCRGGLLWHTYEMELLAEKFCEVFDCLDRELLITGTILHDIGKIRTYETSQFGDTSANPLESLMGHLALGGNFVMSEAKNHHCDPEKVNLLVHMILSHHGQPEFGAVVTPTTTEAFILSQIDNIDSRIFMFTNAQKELEPGQMSEKKVFGVDSRVYRPKNI